MRLVFAGTSDFAVPSLEALLLAEHDIPLIITQADRSAGRGRHLSQTPVKQFAQDHNLCVFQPEKISSVDSVDHLLGLGEIDFFVVVAYGQKIPRSLLEWPKYGVVNVHGSLLPKYRGAAPIQQAIIDGMQETGVTTMLMDEGWDTGDILLQESVKIELDDNYGTLSSKLAQVGAGLLVKTLQGLYSGDISSIPQNNTQATYVYSLKRESGNIDWNKSAVSVVNQIRGCNPKPGAFTVYKNSVLKVWEASVASETISERFPGTIETVDDCGVRVACGSGTVLLKEVQPESRKRMSSLDWARGSKLVSGISFDEFAQS